MSYKWLELWSYKNKWKPLHILIIFNWFWKMKESKDDGGHSWERGKRFCHRVRFAPKWKAEWVTGGSPVLGPCVIDTVFPSMGMHPAFTPWPVAYGEWVRVEEDCGCGSVSVGWSPKVDTMFVALEELIFYQWKTCKKKLNPEQYYWYYICKS